MPLTLDGLTVVDLTQNVAGPYCTQLLGDFGATVIKLERPRVGDDARRFEPRWNGEAAAYLAYNRNKQSICVDLEQSRGRAIIERLVRDADIFVHSLKPGSAEARGLGFAQLARLNPRLIYAAISGFGEVGPQSHLPGYDPLGQAASGIISVNGHPGAPPARVVVPIIDMGSGLWTFAGILAALIECGRTGRGAHVTTSLLETGVAWGTMLLTGYMANGAVPGPAGSTSPAAAPYEAFRTSDGWVLIAAGNDRLFAKLCVVLGMPDLPAEARFASNAERVPRRDELHQLLEPATARLTAAQLVEQLRAAGVPCSPINTIDQVYADAQVNALGMLPAAAPGFRIPGFQFVDIPINLNGEKAVKRLMPPRLGEHTDAVLRAAGYSEAELEALRADGVIN